MQNGIEDSLPCQFHTRFRAYLQKNIYGCRVVINNIVTEVINFNIYAYQKLESRTPGQGRKKNPSPRTALRRTDPIEAKTKGTSASVKKKGFQKSFSGVSPPKKVFKQIFQAISKWEKKGFRKFSARFVAFSIKILTIQKIVLSSSRGQGNFRGLEASRPRTWPLRPRTLKCVLEAEDVLDKSTSDAYDLSTNRVLWLCILRKLCMYHRRSQGARPPPPIKIPLTTKSYDNIAWRCLVAVFFQ